MTVAAIYCRVSTEGQEKEGTSLQTQRDACLNKARELGYVVPEHLIFTEVFSGLTLSRPKLAVLRTEIKEGDLNAVIVYTPDRLCRVGEDILSLVKEFKASGVSLIFVKEQWEDTLNGKLVAFMLGWASEFEAAQIKERTMRTKKELVRKGQIPQGTGVGPYGYDWDKQAKKRVINQAEAETVRRIFEMVAQGLDPYNVAKRLNRRGIPSKTGSQWHPLTIKRMITNPIYTGCTYFGKTRRIKLGNNRTHLESKPAEDWVLLPEATPPIINKALFDEANKVLARPKLRPGKPLHDYPLTGYIVCGYCGSPCIGTTLNHRYRYYRCRGSFATATRPQVCHAKYIKADMVEDIVWEKVKGILANPQVVLQEIKKQAQSTNLSQVDDEIVRKQKELQNNIKAEGRLVTLLRRAQGAIYDVDFVLDQINDVKREREELHQRLEQLLTLKREAERLGNAEAKLGELVSKVQNNLDHCTTEDKRLAFAALSIKVIGTSERICIEGSIPVKFSSTEQTSA